MMQRFVSKRCSEKKMQKIASFVRLVKGDAKIFASIVWLVTVDANILELS